MNDSADPLPTSTPSDPTPRVRRSLSQTFFKGLAISLPPVLTFLIVVWVVNLIYGYVVYPVSVGVQFTIAQFIDESRDPESLVKWNRLPPLDYVGRDYLVTPRLKDELQERLRTAENIPPGANVPAVWLSSRQAFVPLTSRAVPYADYAVVAREVRPSEMPSTATRLYMEVVTKRYFRSLFHLSAAAVIVSIIGIYFIGRFVTVRVGAILVQKFESGVLARLPLVSNVYSSVKQVTDFVFTEQTVAYNRVVAIEYPRRGAWSLGFVTGDGMLDVTTGAGEPCVCVLIPSSPMPMTGYTVQVPKSEILDLNLTIDQAFQYCISCGVLIPPHQKVTAERLQAQLARRFGHMPEAPTAPPKEHGDK